MRYATRQDFINAPDKRVAFIGMSGLGKTYISQALRDTGDWFHYSVDYRIGTRYMGEPIVDNFKREAMRVPFLREMLLSDSIYIGYISARNAFFIGDRTKILINLPKPVKLPF